MKTFRSKSGPFREQPYFEAGEIERICLDELRMQNLCPEDPAPIRIDRFVEKRFGIHPTYDDLPAGLLGFTQFGPKGVEQIVISRSLGEDGSAVAERRLRTTVAHEAGHGLLHAHLFALSESPRHLFGPDGLAPDAPRILCREPRKPEETTGQKAYDGRWWEFQANQAMGALLLPRHLVEKAVDGLMVRSGLLGFGALPAEKRVLAARLVADLFEVNPAAASIRLKQLFPEENARQLTL